MGVSRPIETLPRYVVDLVAPTVPESISLPVPSTGRNSYGTCIFEIRLHVAVGISARGVQ